MLHFLEDTKNVGDIVSLGLVIGTLSQLLPQIAAILSIAWTVIRISEWAWSKIKRRKVDPLDM